MNKKKTQNILICPLGWGLGHASRDIPIIEYLLNQGHKIIVAADAPQLELIKTRFSGIITHEFPSLKIRFRSGKSQLIPLVWYALRLPFFNYFEHVRLRQIISDYTVDIVISDNRYGLWSKKIKTILITHQLRVIPPFPFKWTSLFTEFIAKKWLSRFNQVWIPDFEGINSLAGNLSRNNGLDNLHYIGLLSRFMNISPDVLFSGFEMVVIASGPEPQRSIFVERCSSIAKAMNLSCLIFEGNPQNGIIPRNIDGVMYVGHLPDLQFALTVTNAKYLIVRGGYSTIMDLLVLGVSGLIVPTPGQTEQEFLASELSKKGFFMAANQADLDSLGVELMLSHKFRPVTVEYNFTEVLNSL